MKRTMLVFGIIMVALLSGCMHRQDNNAVSIAYSEISEISDALAFKLEHEELNGEAHPNNPDWIFKDMYIPENNPFRYAELEEVVGLLETGGTGIVYLGFPNCPWCRSFIPVLIDSARDFGIHEILYRNILEDRNILELEDGAIYEARAGHPSYYRLLELLGDLAPVYRGLEDDSIRRVFVPALLFIKDGEVVRYQGVLESFQERAAEDERGGWQLMNDDEVRELTQILMTYFEMLFGNIDDCAEPC